MLDWLGAEGDELKKAFPRVFGPQMRPFGNRSTWIGGLSDGHAGVQWNAGYDPRDQRRWVGVNLEGMQYDGWPVARLIRRELRMPRLLSVPLAADASADIRVMWAREYWQATARPPIIEAFIAPTPIQLRRLTQELWGEALLGALSCLDEKRDYKGRAVQRVTLAASGRKLEGPVSPHLTIVYEAGHPMRCTDFLTTAKEQLQPVHDWATTAAI